MRFAIFLSLLILTKKYNTKFLRKIFPFFLFKLNTTRSVSVDFDLKIKMVHLTNDSLSSQCIARWILTVGRTLSKMRLKRFTWNEHSMEFLLHFSFTCSFARLFEITRCAVAICQCRILWHYGRHTLTQSHIQNCRRCSTAAACHNSSRKKKSENLILWANNNIGVGSFDLQLISRNCDKRWIIRHCRYRDSETKNPTRKGRNRKV